MLCSLLQLARRLIKQELGEQHSQSTDNSQEYSIIQQWKLLVSGKHVLSPIDVDFNV